MDWKKKAKIFLPIIGLGLFVYLLLKLDLVKVFEEVKNANKYYLLISVGMIILFLIFQTLKWFVLAKEQKIPIKFKDAFKINLISNFYGVVTPSKIGSLVRINYVKKYSGETGKSLGNFVIDKIFDISSLFVFVILFGFLGYSKIKIIPLNSLYLFMIIFLFIIGIFFVFYEKRSSKIIFNFLYKKFIPEKLKEKAKYNFDSFIDNRPSLLFLIGAFFLNLISWTIDYLAVFFIGLSLGINVEFWIFLAILPVATLAGQIPITIGGLGTRELVLINLFGLFGVDAVKIFSMSLISIFVNSIFPSIPGLILSFKYKVKKEEDYLKVNESNIS